MTGALVGPLQPVKFNGPWRHRAVQHVIPLPRNTMDPRWRACAEHRTACDCREAEHAEELAELRHEQRALVDAAVAVLAGHRLFHYAEFGAPGSAERRRYIRGDGPLACQCTGCRLVRAADPPGLLMRCDDDGVLFDDAAQLERTAHLHNLFPHLRTP